MEAVMEIARLQENKKQTMGSGNLGFYSRGTLEQRNRTDFKTLELPWKDNEVKVSRIPEKIYWGIVHQSPTFGTSIWIQDVPGRSEILMHPGSFYKNTLGCILAGTEFTHIDDDGILDLINTRKTIDCLVKELQFHQLNKLKIIVWDNILKI